MIWAAEKQGSNPHSTIAPQKVKEFISGILEKFKKQEKSIYYESISAREQQSPERGKRSKNKDYERQKKTMSKTIFEEMGGAYVRQGDYNLPWKISLISSATSS